MHTGTLHGMIIAQPTHPLGVRGDEQALSEGVGLEGRLLYELGEGGLEEPVGFAW